MVGIRHLYGHPPKTRCAPNVVECIASVAAEMPNKRFLITADAIATVEQDGDIIAVHISAGAEILAIDTVREYASVDSLRQVNVEC